MQDFVVKYWMEFVFGLVATGMGYAMKKMYKRINEQEAVKLGVQALLRDRILQAYFHYQEKDFMPIYARENIQQLAQQYFNLGGSGVITGLMEKLDDLPTEKPKEEN